MLKLQDTDTRPLKKLLASEDWIAYDSETWLIAPGRVAPPLVCGMLCGPSTQHRPQLFDKQETLDQLEALLQSSTTIVGHNICFDMVVLLANRPSLMLPVFRAYEDGRILDTMIIEQLRKIAHGWTKFDPRTGMKPKFSLDSLVSEHLGEMMTGKKEGDSWRLRFQELDGMPLEDWPVEAKTYALDDAQYTDRVFRRQVDLLTTEASFAATVIDLRRQVMAAFALHMMSMWGFRTDPTAVDMLEHDLHEHVDVAIQELLATGIYRQKGVKKLQPPSRDMARIRQLVNESYAARGDAPGLTNGGTKERKDGTLAPPQTKTDNETLLKSQHPDLVKLADVGGDQKLLSTYVPKLRSGTRWPINPGYNVLLETGRTSSFGRQVKRPDGSVFHVGINIQNQPRRGGVRECFVPRPGKVFVGCDYSTLEMRTLAQSCLDRFGYSDMANAIKEGKDLHLDMAADILGIEYAEAVTRKKEKTVKDARQLAKAANFGLPGGLGAAKFVDFAWKSYRVQITEDEGKQLKKRWVAKYAEMKQHFADVGMLTAGGATFTHKHARSGRMRGNVGYNDGCNGFFQGMAADGAKLACWAVVKESWTGGIWNEPIPPEAAGPGPSPLYGFRPTGFIHDEIIGESPLRLFTQHAARLSAIMCEAMKWFVPDVPIEAEAHAMYRWFKDAEPVVDATGLLTPWEPPDPKSLLRKLQADHPLLDVPVWSDEQCLALRQQGGDFEKQDWRGLQRAFVLNNQAKEQAHTTTSIAQKANTLDKTTPRSIQ